MRIPVPPRRVKAEPCLESETPSKKERISSVDPLPDFSVFAGKHGKDDRYTGQSETDSLPFCSGFHFKQAQLFIAVGGTGMRISSRISPRCDGLREYPRLQFCAICSSVSGFVEIFLFDHS